ncbi:MAG: hypothetical protein U1E65_09320 [Myxococcota bacterium]
MNAAQVRGDPPTAREWPLALHALAMSISVLAIALLRAPDPEAPEPERIILPAVPSEPPPSPTPQTPVEAAPIAVVEEPRAMPAPPVEMLEPLPEPAHQSARRRPRPSGRAARPPDAPEVASPSPSAPVVDREALGRAARERAARALAERGLELGEAERLPAIASALATLDDPQADAAATVIAALERTTLPDDLLKKKLDLLRRDLEAAAPKLPRERMDRLEERFLELKTNFSPTIGREARQRLLRDVTGARLTVARAIAEQR